jgi:hypothetical protein
MAGESWLMVFSGLKETTVVCQTFDQGNRVQFGEFTSDDLVMVKAQ